MILPLSALGGSIVTIATTMKIRVMTCPKPMRIQRALFPWGVVVGSSESQTKTRYVEASRAGAVAVVAADRADVLGGPVVHQLDGRLVLAAELQKPPTDLSREPAQPDCGPRAGGEGSGREEMGRDWWRESEWPEGFSPSRSRA